MDCKLLQSRLYYCFISTRQHLIVCISCGTLLDTQLSVDRFVGKTRKLIPLAIYKHQNMANTRKQNNEEQNTAYTVQI